MKRLLRYMLYREVYRQLRKAMRSSDSDSDSQPVEPDKAIEERGPSAVDFDGDQFPADGQPIESPEQLKHVLRQMDAYDFEHFVADLWERMGWETEVSAEAADKGVDVIAKKQTPYEQTALIQAKRYGPNTTVGSPEVQQYASLKNQYSGVDKVIIVTTNEFTGQARELANRLNVKLINGDDLVRLIDNNDAADLVAAYLDFIAVQDDAEQPEASEPTTVESQATDTTASSETEPPTQAGATRPAEIPTTNWQLAVGAATLGWIAILVLINVLPETLGGLLILLSWFLLPVGIYQDSKTVREYADWPEYRWAYVVTSLIWIVAVIPGIVYLWRRRKLTQAAEAPSTETASQTFGENDSANDTAVESQPTDGDATGSESAEPTENTNTTSSSTPSAGDSSSDEQYRTIGYENSRYSCTATFSPDGTWMVAHGRGVESDESRMFIYEETELRSSKAIENPIEAAIANTGHTVLIEGLDPDDESGKLTVFTPNGEEELTHYFNANVADCTISRNGQYAATVTYNPDCSTYIFDVEAGSLRTTHENRRGLKQELRFELDNELRLYLYERPEDEPAYAINADAEIVWENESLQRQERVERLLDSDDLSDFEEAIDLLQLEYESTVQENERKEVARQLADTHWRVAKEYENENQDEALRHLDRAKELYFELLPWYDGKQGAAKVLRKQGKHFLDHGNHQQAYDCFHQIEQLEEEYNVQLLTEADVQRLQDLQDFIESETRG